VKLSVVILNYNVRYFLELCLDSVEKALTGISSEIIVVDNCSMDDSCKFVKQNFPQVKLIENQNNYGFSKGNNIGVSHAKGELICLLNPDTLVAEDTFLLLLEFAARHPGFGVIGPKLIDGSGKFLPESKRGIPFPMTAFFKLIGLNRAFPKSTYFNAYYVPFLEVDKEGEVSILVGACMLMKRKNYLDSGGLDEQFFMYGEDIDLCYRMIQSGFQNYYSGKIPIVHFKGESTLKDKKYFNRFAGAMQLFYRKHFDGNFLLNLLYKAGSSVLSVKKLIAANAVAKTSSDDKPICLITQLVNKVSHIQVFFPTHTVETKNIAVFLEELESLKKQSINILFVFDTETVAHKMIINSMYALKDSHAEFAFLSKNSTFILKSGVSNQLGEVQIIL